MEGFSVLSITFESSANVEILGAAREVQQVGQGWILEKANWIVTSSLERSCGGVIGCIVDKVHANCFHKIESS